MTAIHMIRVRGIHRIRGARAHGIPRIPGARGQATIRGIRGVRRIPGIRDRQIGEVTGKKWNRNLQRSVISSGTANI